MENISLTAYNRGIGGYTTDDMLEHIEKEAPKGLP